MIAEIHSKMAFVTRQNYIISLWSSSMNVDDIMLVKNLRIQLATRVADLQAIAKNQPDLYRMALERLPS